MAIIKSELSEGLQLSVKALSDNVLVLNKNIVTLNKTLSGEKSKDGMGAEEAREQKSLFSRIADYLKTLSESSTDKGDSKEGKLGVGFTGIAIALGLLYGYLKKYVAVFGQGLKAILKALDFKLFNGAVTKAITKITSSVVNFATKIGKVFTESKGFKAVKWLVTKVKAFFGAIMNVAKYIGSFLGKMFGMVGKVFSFFKSITGGFSSFIGIFGKFAALAGRLFYPITIIIGLVEGLFKAFERYKTDGIIGAVLGFFEGVVNGIVMKPLDILKDIASWIAEKLGFEQFSALLDSFSFEEMFSGLIDGILNIGEYFTKALEWVKDKFKSVKDALTFWKSDEPKEMEEKEVKVTKTSKSYSGGAAGGAGGWHDDGEGGKVWRSDSAQRKFERLNKKASGKTAESKAEPEEKVIVTTGKSAREKHQAMKQQQLDKLAANNQRRYDERKQQENAKESMENFLFPDSDGMTTKPKAETEEKVIVTRGKAAREKHQAMKQQQLEKLAANNLKKKSGSADSIDNASADADFAKNKGSGNKGGNAFVNAPQITSNNSTNNNLVKPPPKNPDSSLNSYYRQKYI